jgi:hypothetical protein
VNVVRKDEKGEELVILKGKIYTDGSNQLFFVGIKLSTIPIKDIIPDKYCVCSGKYLPICKTLPSTVGLVDPTILDLIEEGLITDLQDFGSL